MPDDVRARFEGSLDQWHDNWQAILQASIGGTYTDPLGTTPAHVTLDLGAALGIVYNW